MSDCCCSPENACDVTGVTAVASVTNVSTVLTLKDKLGAWKVRWGNGRMDYTVEPGLYSVGEPDNHSPVLVSANYKLTFDTLRKNLGGMNLWLLILDTKGVNVWCAAGKGTFGTDELVKRIEVTGLPGFVSHRELILPQLGAPGVSAFDVKKRTGFSVIYGPVRADDIKAFIAAGNIATEEMRRVKFTMYDRLVLTPLELTEVAKFLLKVFGVLFLINLFAARPFSVLDFLVIGNAALIGAAVTPILLPFIPGRAFAFKGWLLGAIGTFLIVWTYGWLEYPYLLLGTGYLLALPAFSAYLSMNFTGASTYTSPSGVLKEMKLALPFIVPLIAAGIVLVLITTFSGV